MEQFWELAKYFLTTLIGTRLGYLFTRKKYNAEVVGEEIKNFDSAIDAYKKMYEDMLNDEHAQKEELKKEVSELKEELAECRKQIMTLTNFVLASAIKRADGDENLEEIRNIIK